MIQKTQEKERAIRLREQGFSYSEILRKIPVAKSTLSLWLRSVKLAKRQKQRLTEKKLDSMRRGWKACRKKRIFITEKIKKEAKEKVGKISKRELWLIGMALYWGEGHKEKRKGVLTTLGNSDPYLIKLYLKWLLEIIEIPKDDINFWIFLHENSKDRLTIVQKYWSDITGFSLDNFQRVSWKKNKINTKRKNIGENYYGLLRVVVRKSINLTRKIQGWIEGIYKQCGVV